MPLPLPGFIKDLIGGGAAKLGESIKDIIDESKFSAEEKAEMQLKIDTAINAHTERMAELTQAEVDSYLEDTQSARDANTKIQESDKASWLSKNFAYCLDALLSASFISMLIMIVYKQVPEDNKELFYTAFGALTGYVSTVINFHRGTSIGSKSNGDALRKLLNK